VFGDKGKTLELVMADKAKRHILYTVYGVCRGSRLMDPEKNPQTAGKGMKESTALIGEFRAINADGEHFASGVCYVPQYLADAIVGQLSDDTDSVAFGFEITAQYDTASATSYVFNANLIGEPKESDPLKEIEAKVSAHLGQKQLAHAKGGEQRPELDDKPKKK